jgi:hypothetical protein
MIYIRTLRYKEYDDIDWLNLLHLYCRFVRNISVSDILTGVYLCSSENIRANSGNVLQVKTRSFTYTVFAIHYLPIIVILNLEGHCSATESVFYVKNK